MEIAQGFREILKHHLASRIERNAKYSLRAFARDIELHPARLSDILNGKKGLSRASAEQIATHLGLDTQDHTYFCNLVEKECARSETRRKEVQSLVSEQEKSFQNQKALSLDIFRAISDWYHMAIIQLMKLPTYQDDKQWISAQLNLPMVVVSDALERLEKLNLIKKQNGRFVPVSDYVISPDGVPTEALKKYHEQILNKAIHALHLQPVDERDFLGLVMPINSQHLPEIKKKVRQFINKLCDEYSEVEGLDRVVHLSTQLFNLTPKLKSGSVLSTKTKRGKNA